ncbi:MAG: IS110 family transposase [Mucilaginibacter sp.]|uniref:IS110 family transposase n=1 Tax=Mucilaginibacter sp. TaxID=1882438 RepID=UPI00326380A5
MLKYSLGLDISKGDFHACLSAIDKNQQVKIKATRKFTNNQQGFKEVLTWITQHCKEKEIALSIVMEATGVYYEKCALSLFKAGFSVSVVLPNKAKKYMQALGLKSKNDKIDAAGLARMAAEQCLEQWQPMADFFYKLRALTRHHQSLQELKTNINNQLHADEHSIYSSKSVIKQLKKLIVTLEKQLDDTAQEIHDHLYSDSDVAKKVDHIIDIKGLGYMTVATILGETNGFALFKSIAQLISYAGYDIVENQSGNHRGKTRISKKGNSHIRRAMHMPAFNMIRYDVGNFKPFFERLLERQQQKMKAYVAVQKKLLALIYTLWKRNEAFKPHTKLTTSGNEETVPSFALAPEGQLNEVAPA